MQTAHLTPLQAADSHRHRHTTSKHANVQTFMSQQGKRPANPSLNPAV